MSRTKKMKTLIWIKGEPFKRSQIIDVVNMNDEDFNYYYENEVKKINSINS